MLIHGLTLFMLLTKFIDVIYKIYLFNYWLENKTK